MLVLLPHASYSFMNRIYTVVSMRCCLLLACSASIPTAWSAPGFTQQNGIIRLIGSSFGVLGINATFDYVVCNFLLYNIPFPVTH